MGAEDEERSPKGQKRSRTETADVDVKEDIHGAPEQSGFNAPASKQAPVKVGSIDPVGDFEKMMAAARDADEDGAVSRLWLALVDFGSWKRTLCGADMSSS